MALMGPRQAGKTTLALDIAGSIPSVYLDLENRIDLQKGTSFSLGRGFHEACTDIQPDKKFVIYAGDEKFQSQNEITAIGLYDFMKILKDPKYQL